MEKEFIPYEQALELKELGFDEECVAYYHTTLSSSNVDLVLGKTHNRFYYLVGIPEHFNTLAPLYQQAFRWFRGKYDFRYSIGKTNTAVVHYGPTTQLLQDNDSYEAAELAAIKWFIDVAKQIENGKN